MWFLIKVKSGKDVGVDEIERYLLNSVKLIKPQIPTLNQVKFEVLGSEVHPATPAVQSKAKIVHIHDNRDNEPHRTLCGDYVRPMPTLELTDHEQSNCPECKTLARILLAKPEDKK